MITNDDPRRIYSDGVYLDLSLADYVAINRLSGSTAAKMETDPGAVTWERAENPLYTEPTTKPTTRGSAAHAIILEGLDAYEARYCVPPVGVLRTASDMSDWLRSAKERGHDVKISGTLDVLRERIAQLRGALNEDERPVFADEVIGDRQVISEEDDRFVRVVNQFARGEAGWNKHLDGGVVEATILWTDEHGTKRKARPDCFTPVTIAELKTYGRAPRRGRELRTQLVTEAYWRFYDLQAVNNFDAVRAASRLALPVVGGTGEQRTHAHSVLAAVVDQPLVRWLFLRMGGAPTGIVIPFRPSDAQWVAARAELDAACAAYRERLARFGDELWLVTHGEQEIEDTDWPFSSLGQDIQASTDFEEQDQ